MPAELQVKLLRVLETGRFMRVGGTASQEADVRIIAATNRDPFLAVTAGRLRDDLLYRLNVFPLDLPPLRARLEDVPLLARHFLAAIVEQEGQSRRFTPAAIVRLGRYHWPGNVRELRNAVQRAYVMAQGELIDETWLPGAEAPAASGPGRAPATVPAAALADAKVTAALAPAVETLDSVTLPIGTSLAQAEKQLMLATLRHYNHHKERTAATLGVSLKTLYNRLREYEAEAGAKPDKHDGL